MPRNHILVLCAAAVLTVGCQADPAARPAASVSPVTADSPDVGRPAAADRSPRAQDTARAQVPKETENSSGAIMAYVNGQPVRAGELQSLLLEAAGGGVLRELVLDRMVARQLEQRQLTVEQADIDAERRILTESLHEQPRQAERLLRELREERGLGQRRFARLLARNAALRKLVAAQIEVDDTLAGQEYQLVHGPRYEARLIVTRTHSQAAAIIRQVQQGESFIDLAVKSSTDPSSAQGGLMPSISPADPTWPVAIRTALERLEPGQLSTPIALEDGFAVLLLQRKIAGDTVQFKDVRDAMVQRAKRRLEQLEMQRLVQALLNQADVVILEPVLERSWRTSD